MAEWDYKSTLVHNLWANQFIVDYVRRQFKIFENEKWRVGSERRIQNAEL